MNKRQRKLLIRLMDSCNKMGSTLDLTATSVEKLVDRQSAHMNVYLSIYYILLDHKDNDFREEDILEAEKYVSKVEATAQKQYKDRSGN